MRHTVHSKAAQAVIFIFQRVTLLLKQLDCLIPVIFDDMLYRFARIPSTSIVCKSEQRLSETGSVCPLVSTSTVS